jgi:hypothetical protein
MLDDNAVHLLSCILDKLESDEYEAGGIYTIGGPPGQYMLKSPYNTECEYLIVGAYLAATSGNGAVAISAANPSITQLSLGQSFGAAAQGSEGSNPFEGVFLPTSATINSLIAVDHWQPLGKGVIIYAQVFTTASYAIIAMRRKLERYIPEQPRLKPHTHSLPVSRRPMRVLPAESPQVAGYHAQYAGGPEGPYQHIVPDNEDPANVGRVARRMARYGR